MTCIITYYNKGAIETLQTEVNSARDWIDNIRSKYCVLSVKFVCIGEHKTD